jgi:nitrite reductase/ring-hydroxylating ferredoxin subunit
MATRIKLCSAADVGPGEMFRVDLPDVPPLAVYNVDGEFYATSNICTHNIAMLTDGYLEGETVECPLHGGCFNVKTGAPTSFPCEKPLQTYRVDSVAGELFTEV